MYLPEALFVEVYFFLALDHPFAVYKGDGTAFPGFPPDSYGGQKAGKSLNKRNGFGANQKVCLVSRAEYYSSNSFLVGGALALILLHSQSNKASEGSVAKDQIIAAMAPNQEFSYRVSGVRKERSGKASDVLFDQRSYQIPPILSGKLAFPSEMFSPLSLPKWPPRKLPLAFVLPVLEPTSWARVGPARLRSAAIITKRSTKPSMCSPLLRFHIDCVIVCLCSFVFYIIHVSKQNQYRCAEGSFSSLIPKSTPHPQTQFQIKFCQSKFTLHPKPRLVPPSITT